jgi:hypothetical protein
MEREFLDEWTGEAFGLPRMMALSIGICCEWFTFLTKKRDVYSGSLEHLGLPRNYRGKPRQRQKGY